MKTLYRLSISADRVFSKYGFNIPELLNGVCDFLIYSENISTVFEVFTLCSSGRTNTIKSHDVKTCLNKEYGLGLDYSALLLSIANSKSVKLENFLYALSIPQLLEYDKCVQVAKHFITLGAVVWAYASEWMAIGFSERDSQLICEEFNCRLDDIESMRESGVKMAKSFSDELIEYPLKGVSIAVFGVDNILDLQSVEVLRGMGANVVVDGISGKEDTILVLKENDAFNGVKNKLDAKKIIDINDLNRIIANPHRYGEHVRCKK